MFLHSPAADRNKTPILEKLRHAFKTRKRVLEVGSGSGQHAVFFATHLPHLTWLPSEMEGMLPGLMARLEHEAPKNVGKAVVLDVGAAWPHLPECDGAFTANTFHIISQSLVVATLTGVGQLLPSDGRFAVYGPFKRDGKFTSESNAMFDRSLRLRDPQSGIRDLEWVIDQAEARGLHLVNRHDMPANNMLLEFAKPPKTDTVPLT